MIVAAGAIAWAGDLFYGSCYILEGDSNIVFRADAVLSRVEDFTGANADDFSINDNEIDGFVNAASELIKSSEEHLRARLDEATADFSSKQQGVDRLLQLINEVKTEQHIANDAKNNGID